MHHLIKEKNKTKIHMKIFLQAGRQIKLKQGKFITRTASINLPGWELRYTSKIREN